jgi:O-antigen/teichoic acid export membrane protein
VASSSRRRGRRPRVLYTAEPLLDTPPPLKLSEPSPGVQPGGALANSTLSFISQLASGAFTAILTLFLVRSLGASRYGAFALATSVGTLVAFPADFGVSSSAARFVAENRTLPARVAEIVADAVRLKVIATLLACGALVLAAPLIAHAYHAPLTGPLRLIALAIVGQNFMFLFEATFVASGRMGINARVAIGESTMECTASIVIVLLGGGLVGACTGRAIGYLTGAVLGAVAAARAFGWQTRLGRSGRVSHAGRIARYAVPTMLVDSATALFAMVDVLLIGAYLGPRQAGLFSAPVRLLTLLLYIGNAVSSGVAPRLAHGVDGREPDGALLVRGLRLLFLLQSLMLAPLIIWTKPIAHILLGGGYDASIPTLRCLSIALYLGGAAPLISASATYLGEARRRAPLMIGATLLDGVLDVILIPRIGIISGAIATAAAYAVMFAGHFALCRRHVRLDIPPLVTSAARGLAAAGVMALALLLFGSDPSIPVLLLGGIFGSLVFVAALILLGELRRSELKAVAAWLGARIPRGDGS